ncbi:MAG: TetR/AcrR family transcriptional regulator [Actinobacteria bacterium]|nr:TetR/AcrR family transcriptional regulator [Actinomycetota bacterium]
MNDDILRLVSGTSDIREDDPGEGLEGPPDEAPEGVPPGSTAMVKAFSDGLPFPVDDPLSSLHPSARVILEAARQILAQEGFAALSLQAIAHRAGMNKAAVHYHFGSKDGLIVAIVDALIHDECLDLVRETRSLSGEQKLRAYIRGILGMVNDAHSFQNYFELLPYIVRDPILRARVADLYRWYFQWTISCVGFEDVTRDPGVIQAFAQLVVAISDGLALQRLLNPDGFAAEHPYALLESLLYDVMAGRARVDRFSDLE